MIIPKPISKLLIFLLLGINTVVFSQENSTKEIVNSIKDYINVFSPSLSYKYVKTPDGRDINYTDFLKEKIDSSKGSDIYLLTSLTSFSSLMATISKSDAKEYGIQNNSVDSTRFEYQKYLFLSLDPKADESKKIELYINSIRSISFHLKVKYVPAYKDVNNILNNLEKIISDPKPYNIKLWYCHSAFSYALGIYAKVVVYRFLPQKEIDKYENRFKDLDNKKQKLINQISNEDIPIEALSDGEMKLMVSYFSIINEAISSLLNSDNE
jgi:hypothetical protein